MAYFPHYAFEAPVPVPKLQPYKSRQQSLTKVELKKRKKLANEKKYWQIRKIAVINSHFHCLLSLGLEKLKFLA